MGRLLVSSGCSLALRAFAPPNRGFHDRLGLPISDRHGHPRFGVGQVRAARARRLALSVPALRSPVGASRLPQADSPLGSARHEPLATMTARLHAVQISFFRDPQERPPAQLLEAWPTL